MIKRYPDYFSYSSMQTFFSCPLKYKLQYIDRIKATETRNIYGIFGTSFHTLLEKYYQAGNFSREELTKNWKTIFAAEMKRGGLCIIGNYDYQRLLKQGYPILQNFFTFQEENGNLIKPIAVEKKFKYYYKIDGNRIKTSGKIDIILKTKEGFEVIDYKTGKVKDNETTLQLILYGIAFQKLYKKENYKVCLHYLKTNTKKCFTITKKDKLRLFKKIKEFYYGVYTSTFEPTPSSENCKYCQYKGKCSINNLNEKDIFKKGKKLLPYQKIDAGKMIQNQSALVANDMGTGKTPIAIFVGEYLRKNNNVKKILVLTLNVVKNQWAEEIDKFSKEADYIVINGNASERKKQYREETLWKIMAYSTLQRDIDIIEKKYDVIILDDPSVFRNWKTRTSKAINKLKAKYKYILYATPIENNLAEIYNLIRFLDFRVLGRWDAFDKKYIERGFFNAISGYKNIREFRNKIKDIIIRRTFDSVIKGVPMAITKNKYIEIKGEQKELYNAEVEKMQDFLQKNLKGKNVKKIVEAETLAKFTYLREICDSPELIGSTIKSAKLETLKEMVKKIIPQKVIVFTEFAKMAEIIYREIENCIIITGNDNIKQKTDKIEKFKNSTNKNILVCTDVLSYGVNLQFCHYLINFDLPFTFSEFIQRIGRERRIGQKYQVIVINFIMKNSVEERILEILNYKKKLTNIIDNKKVQEIRIPKSRGITNKIIKDIVEIK